MDASSTDLAWARENMSLNGIGEGRHHLERAEVREFLRRAAGSFGRWDLCILEPPSSSTRGGPSGGPFDVQRDHATLVREALSVLREGGVLWFTTSSQKFTPHLEGLPVSEVVDMTARTLPEDYRNPHIHRCWRLVK